MHDDPEKLRAEAERLQREEATLRARADALGRRAIELVAQAQEIERAQSVVPLRKRWNGLAVVDGVVSVDEARRSANPDAVAREARLECVKPGAEAMKSKGNKTRERVEAAWREASEGKPEATVVEIAERLGVSARTVWAYKPKP
jgi:predicted ribosome quality control (RQC) complex YloA/Tae2 family protein